MHKIQPRWLLSILLGAFICIAPTNLFLTFPTGAEYVSGVRVDYLIPKLYASQLAALAVMACFICATVIMSKRKNQAGAIRDGAISVMARQTPAWLWITLVGLLAVLVLRQAWTPMPVIGLLTLVQLTFSASLAVVVIRWRTLIDWRIVTGFIAVSMIFQVVVGGYQLFFQRSVAGYWLFGEPELSRPLSLAKTVWQGRELILPYGTTAHPNIWAGWLVANYLFMLATRHLFRYRTRLLISAAAFLLALTGCLVTLSLSALCFLLLGTVIFTFRSAATRLMSLPSWLLLAGLVAIAVASSAGLSMLDQLVPGHPSIRRRDGLQAVALSIIRDQPFGTGLGQSTIFYRQYHALEAELAPFVQPVHSVFLLFLTEAGIIWVVTVVLFYLLHGRIRWRQLTADGMVLAVTASLPVLLADHYLLSLVPGNWLFMTLAIAAHLHIQSLLPQAQAGEARAFCVSEQVARKDF